MLNLTLYAALRLTGWLLPAVPESLAYRMASFVGTFAYYVFPIARGAMLANYEIALPLSTPKERERLAHSAFRNDAKNWLDTLRIVHLSSDEILERVPVDGLENLEQAVREGTGAILVSLHLGNFDLVGQVLATRGYKLTVPVERMRPERLFRFLKRLRESQGVRLVTPDGAPRAMIRALKSGEFVGMAADRHLSGRGVKVKLFGREASLARGPAALALRTGAPVFIAVGVRVADGRFQGFVGPPLTPVRNASHAEDERSLSQEIACRLEDFIARFPDQWLGFTRLWPARYTLEAAATIEQQKGAAV